MTTHALRSFAAPFCVLLLVAGCLQSPDKGHMLQGLQQQAELRVFQDARQAIHSGNYDLAILLFQRLLTHYPSSSLHNEARWRLAHSYQHVGNLRVALQYFRVLAQRGNRNPYQKEATFYVTELMQRLGVLSGQSGDIQGLIVPLASFAVAAKADHLLKTLSRKAYTTLILEIPCFADDPRVSNTVATFERPSLKDTMRTTIKTVVPRIHQYIHTVLLSVNLRCFGQMQSLNEWADWSYHPAEHMIRPSRLFDLFHPNYQDFLVEELTVFLKAGVDGILFHTDVPLGARDGFSPWALHVFEQDFGMPIEIDQLFSFRNRKDMRRFDEGHDSSVSDGESYSPLFWRWVGWKARTRLAMMSQIVQHLRQEFPYTQFGLEIHVESVVDPVTALVQYSEDWVAATQSRFDFFFLKIQSTSVDHMRGPFSLYDQAHSNFDWSDILEKMVATLGDPQKLWVSLPDPSFFHAPRSRSCCQNQFNAPTGILPKRVGRIYERAFFP